MSKRIIIDSKKKRIVVQLTPDIIDLVEKLGLGHDEEMEVYGELANIPPEKRQKYLIDLYGELGPCPDEDDF